MTVPKDIHVLTPGTCECCLTCRRDFADEIRCVGGAWMRCDPEMGRSSRVTRGAVDVTLRVLTRGRQHKT